MIERKPYGPRSIRARGRNISDARVTSSRAGGVLERPGHTEASVDLARLAGLHPSGVICEIMKDDGSMAHIADLIQFSTEHQLKMITVAELIRYRLEQNNTSAPERGIRLPTQPQLGSF